MHRNKPGAWLHVRQNLNSLKGDVLGLGIGVCVLNSLKGDTLVVGFTV